MDQVIKIASQLQHPKYFRINVARVYVRIVSTLTIHIRKGIPELRFWDGVDMLGSGEICN